MNRVAIRTKDTKRRQIQQPAAAKSIYACKTRIFDTLLTAEEIHETQMVVAPHKIKSLLKIISCFVWIDSLKLLRNYCLINAEHFIHSNNKSRIGLYFVQWYKTTDVHLVEIDTNDKQLGFYRLRSQPGPGKAIQSLSIKKFGLVLV